jgi:precorrin-2 dehydrogenase / sirohydrochlorin ferrochelatase
LWRGHYSCWVGPAANRRVRVRNVIVRSVSSWYPPSVKSYPISLIGLADRCVVVIGGGSVALRKIEGLIQAGAKPRVIALKPSIDVAALAAAQQLTLEERAYRTGDLAAAQIVVAATNNPEVNHAVAKEAHAVGSLVNVVDDPEHSNFILPAVVRRGEVTVAVSTGGSSPALARRLREGLESLIGEEVGGLAQLLADLRPELLAVCPPGEARLAAALRIVDDSGVRERLVAGEAEAARERARMLLSQPDAGEDPRSTV